MVEVRGRAERGFTLFEFGIVLLIVGVLTMVLMPAFTYREHRTQASACMDNLRQIGQIALLYAEDYDQELTPEPARHNLNFIPRWRERLPAWSAEDRLLAYGMDDELLRSPLDTITPIERALFPWIEHRSHFKITRTSYRLIEKDELGVRRVTDLVQREDAMLARTPNYHLHGKGFAAVMADGSAQILPWEEAARLVPSTFGPLNDRE